MNSSTPTRDFSRYVLRTIIMFVIFLLSVCLASSVQCARVTLEWDQCSHPLIQGYRIYYGTASGNYTDQVEVSGVNSTNANVGGLQIGTTYYFAATSFTRTRESDYSQEIDYTPRKSSSGGSAGCVYSPNTGQGIVWLILLLHFLMLRGIRIIQTNGNSINPENLKP